MKRLWSSLFTAAALGCLVALWTLPAAAYYPPLQATATWGNGVSYDVYDPKLQKQQVGGHIYGGAFVADCQQDHGVIAWIVETVPMPGATASYFVNFCVYDPAKAKFMEESQGPYKSVSLLTVKDGVVAYVVPSTNFPGWDLAKYATYDPTVGWMKSSLESASSKITTILNNDGMVVFLLQDPNGPTSCNYAINGITFDIYDPKLAKWATTYYFYEFISVVGITNPHISNATLFYEAYKDTCSNPTKYSGMVGYRPDYQDPYKGDPWSLSLPTTPLPWFWAQPDPLWVWFTDMSIGATIWIWDFGDEGSSFERSTYHVYPHAGRFTVILDINGGAGGVTITTPVTVGWGPQAVMLLLID
jgi:hypothetical protein